MDALSQTRRKCLVALLRPFFAVIGISSEIEMEEKPMTNSEEIIYAPIEIESADQLHALGATWEDCKTWRIGVTPIKVVLVPSNQETRDFLIQEMRRKYVNRHRQTRCLVPGRNNRPVTCPERNHCDCCPYGLNADDRSNKVVSLDSLLEDGYEVESDDTTADPVVSSMYLEDVLRHLRGENPVFLDIVYLRADGLTLDELSGRLNIPRTTLHRMLQKIKRIAESV